MNARQRRALRRRQDRTPLPDRCAGCGGIDWSWRGDRRGGHWECATEWCARPGRSDAPKTIAQDLVVEGLMFDWEAIDAAVWVAENFG